MNRAGEDDTSAGQTADPAWLRDWETIWRTELAAIAVDREALEGTAAAARAWAGLAAVMQGACDGKPDTAGATGYTTGAAPAAAAPGSGGNAGARDDIERLNRRIAELERRLDQHNIGAQPRKRVRRVRPGKPVA